MRRERNDRPGKGRSLRKLQDRFADEVCAVVERHAVSWPEACALLHGAGFGPEAVRDLVRTSFVAVDCDVDDLRIDLQAARPGALLLPAGIGRRLVAVAEELRGRADALARHPAGTSTDAYPQAC